MKASLFAAAAVAAISISAPANAAAVSMAKDLATVAAPEALAEAVHFSHRSCQLGRYGWHLHARGNRIECRPFRRVIRRYY
jgi:hypothetical protein